MTQSNILSREQAVYLGLESTVGVTPSGSVPNAMTRFVASEPVIVDGAVREMLDVSDIRVRRLDAIQPVQGLEIASKLTVSQLLKATPSASQLTAGTSPAALSAVTTLLPQPHLPQAAPPRTCPPALHFQQPPLHAV